MRDDLVICDCGRTEFIAYFDGHYCNPYCVDCKKSVSFSKKNWLKAQQVEHLTEIPTGADKL
jgi:hypothetical protein